MRERRLSFPLFLSLPLSFAGGERPAAACRREEAKVKTTEAVSDQVLPQARTEAMEGAARCCTGFMYRPSMRRSLYIYRISDIHTLNALKLQ